LTSLTAAIPGDPDILAEFSADLTAYTNQQTATLTKDNYLACREYAADLLNQLFSEFDQQLKT